MKEIGEELTSDFWLDLIHKPQVTCNRSGSLEILGFRVRRGIWLI